MVNVPLFNEKCKYILSDFEFLQDPADRNCKLGSGSFASVKLAKERKTGNLFALKVVRLHTNKPTLANEIYNIKAEIYIHRKLNHSNIIKFHDYIQHESTIYLILDYAENGNLYTYLHRKKFLQEKEIFRFFYQTCQAIKYLHDNDVIHRDIKPENLLLDTKNNIKLCDFGWATQRIKDKRVTFCGTYEYMAPEIVHKKPYDYRVDIWSLGVLLYELIHGESPYKGRSLPEIVKSLARGLVKFSYNCNSEAKDLIQKLLKQNPSDRLNLEDIMSHPWVLYHLSKEENSVIMTLPKERILLHSHSLPAEVPKESQTTKNASIYDIPKQITKTTSAYEPNKENTKNTSFYDLHKETTPTNNKAERAEYWTDFYQKRTDYHQSNSLMYTPTNDKNTKPFHTANANVNLNVSQFDDSARRPLQPCGSNQNLHLNLRPFEENGLNYEPSRDRSHSPISPFNHNQNDQLAKTPDAKSKIFETNIFSPSFKNKLTNVIRQLTVQTNNTSSRKPDKVINQTAIPSVNQNISMGYVPQQDRSYCHAAQAREEAQTYRKEENKSAGLLNSFSLSTLQPRQDLKPTQLGHMKNLKEPISLPKGDDFPIALSSTSTTRTNTSDISYGPDVKSPLERSNRDQAGKIKFPLKNDKETISLVSDRTRMNKAASISTNPNPNLNPRDKTQGNFNKKALELKGMLGPNVIRYHIPITMSTTRNARNNKENLG